MKISKFILLLICAGFVGACNSETKSETKTIVQKSEEKTAVEEEKIKPVEQEVEKKLVTYEDFLQDYLNRKNKLIEKLKTSTPQFANFLYLEFRKKNGERLSRLNDLEENILGDYEGLYNNNGNISYKKYGNKIHKAEAVGLEFRGIGEGYTEIREKPSEYMKIFGGKVTPDAQNFIILNQKDNEVLMVNDAGLVITFLEMGNVVLRWEKFIQKYPKSEFKKEAKQLYEYYQMWYLFGLDNTPTRDYETGELYEENKLEMERFIKFNPTSPTTKLVKMMLESTANTEVLQKKIAAAQDRLLDEM